MLPAIVPPAPCHPATAASAVAGQGGTSEGERALAGALLGDGDVVGATVGLTVATDTIGGGVLHATAVAKPIATTVRSCTTNSRARLRRHHLALLEPAS